MTATHTLKLRSLKPHSGRRMATFEDERVARLQAETRAYRAEARARELGAGIVHRRRSIVPEARARELGAEMRRLRDG